MKIENLNRLVASKLEEVFDKFEKKIGDQVNGNEVNKNLSVRGCSQTKKS